MPQVAPQVGIVLVSHSSRLAEGVAELAGQVSGGTVTIVAAGGMDDGGLGTSAAKVEAALARAESGAGVLVLPDLGSAVLTVRALLAERPDAARPITTVPVTTGPVTTVPLTTVPVTTVTIADAPFVEGAVAATVAAAAGADLMAVAKAAEEAWHARKL
jgi:PTS hybrid protein